MKKLFFATVFILTLTLAIPVFAQRTSETAADEAKGKEVWDKLQSKEVDCKNLTDDDFDVLGDYYMGLMAGNNHEAMNNRMSKMMGDDGEKQMHIAMGKRLSNCDPTAIIPQDVAREYYGNEYYGNMMGRHGFWPLSIVAGTTLILYWVFMVFGILALRKYIGKSK